MAKDCLNLKKYLKLILKADFKLLQDLPDGTKVLLKNNRKFDRKGGNLEDSWVGPYTVVSKTTKGSYKLRNKHGKELAKCYTGSQLKVYKQ